jgi:hypothetical protein
MNSVEGQKEAYKRRKTSATENGNVAMCLRNKK